LNKPDSKESNIPAPEFYDAHDSDNVCFLCGAPKYKHWREITHFGFPFTFQQCHCGIIKQTPMPNKQFFEWFFNSELFFSSKSSDSDKIWGFYDYFKDEPCRLATSRYRYKKFKNIFSTGKPLEILKIGPSTGTFLYVANQHHHHAIGCDVSTQFAKYAKDNYDVHIDTGRFEEMPYQDKQFDVIMLFNVIENIPNQTEFLSKVAEKLKPGGYFILNHVNIENNIIEKIQKNKYFLYRPPICYIYSTDVFDRVLNKFGFEIVHRYRDVRYLHLEKIFTLLGWPLPLKLSKLLKLHQIPFPIYAYPSSVTISKRIT